MAQHDFDIANQSAPNFRQDLNNALEALSTLSSGTSDPSGDINNSSNMLWYDTANNQVKMRNEADDGWITLFTLDQTGNTSNIAKDSADTDLANDPDAAARRDIVKAYVDGDSAGPVATTSGSAVEFNSIPADVTEIEVILNGTSLTGTTTTLFQLSSGGVYETTGYSASCSRTNVTSVTQSDFTTGIPVTNDAPGSGPNRHSEAFERAG